MYRVLQTLASNIRFYINLCPTIGPHYFDIVLPGKDGINRLYRAKYISVKA